jgi:protocatechuate 3,4-dioxygenase, alpha subunit
MTMSGLTPSQTIGPFFIEALKWAIESADRPLAPGTVRVVGRLSDVNGNGAGDALLEIWQPAGQLGEAIPGFQRVATGDDGRFSFRMPAPGAQQVTADVTILTRGLQRHVFTRVHIGPEGDPARVAVPASVPPERRTTLIATRSGSDPNAFEWNVRLRGADETVFFDL